VSTTAAAAAATQPPAQRASAPIVRWKHFRSPGDLVFVAGLGALLAYAAWLGRNISFFSDDWDIIAFHHNGRYLTPYNGHLWLVPIGIFHTLYVTVGLRAYAPYRAVGLVCYGALGIAFYGYARRRVGPTLAAIAALSVMWFSTAQYNLMFPLLMNFSLPLAATVVIWILLDRESLRCDIAAGGCLAVALASNSVGLITAAAVGTELLVRRDPPRRWLPFVPPLALWLLWYAVYHTSTAGPGGAGAVVRYAAHEIQATFAAFAGGSDALGYVLLVATAVLFTLSIVRWHTFNARAAGALAAVLAFALLTSYTRAGFVPPVLATTPRYLWFNGFFLVVAVVEVVSGLHVRWPAALVGTLVVVVGAVTLVGNLRDYHDQVVTYGRTVRTYMVAVDAIPDRIGQQRVIPFSYITVRVGAYLTAIRHLGSPLGPVTLRALGSEHDRSTADSWMIHDLDLRFRTVSVAPGSCAAVPPSVAARDLATRGPVTVVVRAGSTPVVWSLRRLAVRFHTAAGSLAPGDAATLTIPPDHSSLPWHVRIQGAAASVSVCR
jgi:hypothetical protein